MDKLGTEELKDIRSYCNQRINSWNSKILIKDVCYDYELREKLLSMGINNMEEITNNSIRDIPDSLIEKTYWLLSRFDFEKLQKRYEERCFSTIAPKIKQK